MNDQEQHAEEPFFREPLVDLNALEGLLERVKEDETAPFGPEVLAVLKLLRQTDRGAYATWRGRLKKANRNFSVGELDACTEPPAEDQKRGPSVTDLLVEIGGRADLWHTNYKRAFADIIVNERRETHPIRSAAFKGWLRKQYRAEHGRVPNAEAMALAIEALSDDAQDGPERQVFPRVGEHDGAIYVDLGDETWEAIEVTKADWRIVNAPPCRFLRTEMTMPLPRPVKAGGQGWAKLKALLNISPDEWPLAKAWVLQMLQARGSFALLVLIGEFGTAKTTTAEMIRKLVDPNKLLTRTFPRDERELYISATRARVLVYDNISGLSRDLSDAFCRLATGGGFATRHLYTDDDEMALFAELPLILNGIGDMINRPDLASRCMTLHLESIPEDERRLKQALDAEFVAAHPEMLGDLLDAAVVGLQRFNEPGLLPKKLPRMADFANWAIACEPAHDQPGTFLDAYVQNQEETQDTLSDADPLVCAVLAFLKDKEEWVGSSSDLLALLTVQAPFDVKKNRAWPKSSGGNGGLSSRLRGAALHLRNAGWEVGRTYQGPVNRRRRAISLTRRSASGSAPAAAISAFYPAHPAHPAQSQQEKWPMANSSYGAAEGPWGAGQPWGAACGAGQSVDLKGSAPNAPHAPHGHAPFPAGSQAIPSYPGEQPPRGEPIKKRPQ